MNVRHSVDLPRASFLAVRAKRAPGEGALQKKALRLASPPSQRCALGPSLSRDAGEGVLAWLDANVHAT
jgi:hypothetical protein